MTKWLKLYATYCVSKNVPSLTSYRLNIHPPIFTIFGTRHQQSLYQCATVLVQTIDYNFSLALKTILHNAPVTQ